MVGAVRTLGGGGEIHGNQLTVGKGAEDRPRRCSGILRNGLEKGAEMRKDGNRAVGSLDTYLNPWWCGTNSWGKTSEGCVLEEVKMQNKDFCFVLIEMEIHNKSDEGGSDPQEKSVAGK